MLIETKLDNKGNTLSVNKTAFKTTKEMNLYQRNNMANKVNNIIPYTIGDGGTSYTYYSKIKVGLSEYKYSSSHFFVACVFEWLSLPTPGFFSTSKLKGVLGLALNPQLSMIAGTYGGRVSYTSDWVYGTQFGRTSYMLNTNNGGISIKATGTQGIGFSFSIPHYSGANFEIITAMDGVISCHANKSNSYDNYCSAYGEYAHVSSTLSLDNFSVSIPLGISFGSATSKTAYSHQASLDIR